MHVRNLYYSLKAYIPRRLQLYLRRQRMHYKRSACSNVWPIDEWAAKKPVNWRGWPDGKRFALVLTHDVDTVRGQERCRDLMEREKNLGFRSSFNFVPRRYDVSAGLRKELVENGFEVGVHGLYHDGKYYTSREVFAQRAKLINTYLKEWDAVGFRSPSMQHNLEWIHDLDIEYDASTFDTDPFEPQPDGVRTIFPFWVYGRDPSRGYVELPYTLPQDFTVFILMSHRDIGIWKEKLAWIAGHGGMALLISHPDYMSFNGSCKSPENYPADYYCEFLEHVKKTYDGQYWHALPRDVARFVQKVQEEKPAQKRTIGRRRAMGTAKQGKIWFDLDNSPHVPLFKPIIDELNHRGFDCMITSRDCFQVSGLVDMYGLKSVTIGKHYGKNTLMKLFGLMYRGAQLAPQVIRERPALAISHGSRSQHLVSHLMGIPMINMSDYEYVKELPYTEKTWVFIPEYIPAESIHIDPSHVSQYPGLKEDAYVPNFKPDASIMKELGLREDQLIVTVRPPATEAHYHNPESEELFAEVMNYFGTMDEVTMVLLPRNEKQASVIRKQWPHLLSSGKAVIPGHVINGLNLMWHSDLVISGGGTMNREAAALGVPVYSIFRGTIGAVDHYLAERGRLVLLESTADIRTKIRVERRDRSRDGIPHSEDVMHRIVDEIIRILGSCNDGNGGRHH